MRIATILCVLLTLPAAALAGVECESFSSQVSEPGRMVLAAPGRTAPTMSEQGVFVTVVIRDCLLAPIEGYPAQDIWLDGLYTSELALCQHGSIADAPTDATGTTTISGAIAAGGSTTHGTQVWANGSPFYWEAPLDLNFVSPDIDGDLDVDLFDFALFGEDFGAFGRARSDLHPDGEIDLLDLTQFGIHFGETCP